MPLVKGRDHVIDKQIGTQLRLLRMERGLSQEQLGDQIGVTFQQIQKYETGANSIACARMHRLCEAIHITPNNLFELVKFNGKPAPIGIAAMEIGLRIQKLRNRKHQAAILKMLEAFEDEGEPT